MKRLWLLIVVFLSVPLAHAATTIIPGDTVNRVWPQSNTRGQQGLQVLGTYSGTNLYALKSITGTDLYGVRIAGGGLVDCDTAAVSKLLWDAATKTFSCGTDFAPPPFNSGAVLVLGDARYLKKQGDTATGAISIDLANVTSGIGLKILESASGNILHAEKDLTSSGTLTAVGTARFKANVNTVGTISGAALNVMNGNSYFLGSVGLGKAGTPKAKLDVAGAMSGTAVVVNGNSNIAGNESVTGSLLAVGNISTRSTLSGKTLTVMNGNSYFLANVGIGKAAAPKATLDVLGSLSGTALIISGNGNLRGNLSLTGTVLAVGNISTRGTLSGATLTVMNGTSYIRTGALGIGTTAVDAGLKLEVVGTVSGATINANVLLTGSTLQGFGLYDCSNTTTSKLLYNAGTKKFSCASDQTGGGGGGLTMTSKTANYTAADGDYVLADASAGGFDVTLPAASSNRRVGVKLVNTSSSNTVYVKSSSANIYIGSGSTLSGSIVLYLVGDDVTLQNDGTNWHITADHRIAHRARMTREAAQSINSATLTQIDFDAKGYDFGQIASTTTDKVTIRRPGTYHICVSSSRILNIDAGESVAARLNLNGTDWRVHLVYSTAADTPVESSFCTDAHLLRQDVVLLNVRHDEGAAQNTDTGNLSPYLTIDEIRP